MRFGTWEPVLYSEVRRLEHGGDQLAALDSPFAYSAWLGAAKADRSCPSELKQHRSAVCEDPRAFTEASLDFAINVQYALRLLERARRAPTNRRMTRWRDRRCTVPAARAFSRW